MLTKINFKKSNVNLVKILFILGDGGVNDVGGIQIKSVCQKSHTRLEKVVKPLCLTALHLTLIKNEKYQNKNITLPEEL